MFSAAGAGMYGDSHKHVLATKPSNWDHTAVIRASVYMAVLKYDNEHKDDRTLSKEAFAAHAADEADKLCELKGLTSSDREKAREDAKKLAEELYSSHH
jgi:hypothetical protein